MTHIDKRLLHGVLLVAMVGNVAIGDFLLLDNGETVRLAGNSEGLVYLASVLLSLAVEQREDHHVHLGEGEVLDQCDKGLVLAFKKAEWDAP